MAYDLAVGKSNKVKDNPVLVGSIEFDEFSIICSLAKKSDNFFLHRISNLFEDQTFQESELEQAKESLLRLLPGSLPENQRILLHKLIAVVSYALHAGEPLHGIAD